MSEGAKTARALLRDAVKGSLATLGEHGPYVSLVLVADDDGDPFFLLSRLAEHTKNLERDPRASLLIEPASTPDPLGAARAIGEIARVDDEALRARFVARHPSASRYAGFRDFSVYGLSVARVHIVAGFGRIEWIDRSDYDLDDASRS